MMSVVGIIAEYNPLHKGHLYHMESARKLTEAAACVCVLSSNFIQRGEPAVVNKWARAKMALYSGADLVIELPSAFSCASAEYFASGAVSILESLNCVDYLCFGSEEGNLDKLEKTAEVLAFEGDDFRRLLRQELDGGLSFAAARQKVLERLLMNSQDCGKYGGGIQSFLSEPNNILGIEYIKAIKRTGSSIKPVTIGRIGQGYNSLHQALAYSSASAVRKHLYENYSGYPNAGPDSFLVRNLPETSLQVISEEFVLGRGPVFPEAFETLLLHLLRSTPNHRLTCLPYIGEGLENRLKQAALRSATLKEFVSSAVTSRYPASRVKRILCALLTGMTAEFLEELKSNGYAQYIRVLGFNEKGRKILSDIRKKAQLPMIIKPAGYGKLQNSLAVRLFEHEIRTTDVYVLGYPNRSERSGGTELTASPIYLKS